VVERGTNNIVASGTIILFDEPGNEVARTQVLRGHFIVTAPTTGRHRLRFDGIGYRTTYTPLFDLGASTRLAVTVQVRLQTPVALDTVDVAGAPVPARLAEFYQRRRAGFGSSMAREEFEPFSPARVSDVTRRMRGFTIVPNPQYLRRGDTRRYLFFNSRLGAGVNCPPLLFVDGVPVGTAATFDFDGSLPIEQLDALEMYNGSANIPIRFHLAGADCGVIAMWTRDASPRTGQASSSHLDLGWQVGGRLTTGGVEYGRIGVQAGVGVADIVEAYLMLNTVLRRPTGGTSGSGGQILGALRVRPLGARSLWYLGTGVTRLGVTVTPPGDFSAPVRETHHVMLTGLTFPRGVFRPFVEIQLLSPLAPSRAQTHFFSGVRLRLH